MGGGTGQRGPGRRQRTAGGAGQTEPGEVRQKGETRRAAVEGHPRHAGPGEARPGVPGASGVHPEGDREPQRRWGACWMRLGRGGGGSRAAGLWSPCSSAHRGALRVPSPRGRRHPPADTQQRRVQVLVLLSRCEPRCLWRPCRPVTFHITFCTSG